MSTLDKAIEIAAKAHAGQVDKGGAAYILHAVRVMMRMKTDTERIVAVLHDVLEDCPEGGAMISDAGFGGDVVTALKLLRHDKGLSDAEYLQYADGLLDNTLARRVKIADLTDNLNPDRLPEVTEEDAARMKKYYAAWAKLCERQVQEEQAAAPVAG